MRHLKKLSVLDWLTFFGILFLLVCVIVPRCWMPAAQAADIIYPATTGLVAVSMTNPYAVFIDAEPGSATLGMVYDTTTGTAATGNTWAGNVCAVTKDDQSECQVVTIPPLPDYKLILVAICDNAAPAKTDLMAGSTIRMIYSPYAKRFYGDTLPTGRGRVYTGAP